MNKLDIKIYDDPLLREKARPIEAITAGHQQLAAEMAETMYQDRGIGLAANQVGVPERMIVIDVEWSEKRNGKNAHPPNPIAMLNPEILEEGTEDDVLNEGCLSLPEIEGDVWRPIHIRFRYQDLAGVAIEREADGLLARCVLHEVDHLNGVLFIDRLAAPERERLAGKLAKLRKLRQERLVQAS